MNVDALDPQGPGARIVATIFWILLALAVIVFAYVMAAMLLSLRHRDDGEDRPSLPAGVSDNAFITMGGVIVPFVILVVVGIVTVRGMNDIATAAPDPLRVDVEGADWFWNVRYPTLDVTTANEIRVPVGQPVEAVLTTRDVIHSFWVPRLVPKMDMIPGQPNTLRFTAEQPGEYRGFCTEFCGIQHANMKFVVIAVDRPSFDAWAAGLRAPPAPAPGAPSTGRTIFEQSSCAGCHRVRGTTAAGTAGPDLTGVGARRSLGAGAVDNTDENMRLFITRAQTVKPGNAMPDIDLPPGELDVLVAYLRDLR